MNAESEPVAGRVSVIIPAYNHERYVGAAVDSVLAQTYPDWELIVIDDGSTDGTPEVLKRYEDSRIHVFRQANQDAFNALNAGLARVTGDFVAILNSDDVYHPDRLNRLVSVQRETGAVALFTDVQPIDAAGRPILDPRHPWLAWHAANRRVFFEVDDLYTAFLNGNFMIGTSNLFLTAETVRRVGPFAPLRYLHDYDYIFRVLLTEPGRVRYVHDEKLMSYRIHGGNTLSQGAITAREQDRQVITTYLLAGVPDGARQRVAMATARLIRLEQELGRVRAELAWPVPLRGLIRWASRLRAKWGKMGLALAAGLGLAGAVQAQVQIGSGTADVLRLMGPPLSELTSGEDTLAWSYPQGTVEFEQGRAKGVNLLTPAEPSPPPPPPPPPSSPPPPPVRDPLALALPGSLWADLADAIRRKATNEVAALLVKLGGSGADEDRPAPSQDPLFITIQERDEGLVSLLLRHGYDPNILDDEGCSPLSRVIQGIGLAGGEAMESDRRVQARRVTRRLLDAGARVEFGSEDRRPLNLAGQAEDLELIEMLQAALTAQSFIVPPEMPMSSSPPVEAP
jgi:hypothetical protein